MEKENGCLSDVGGRCARFGICFVAVVLSCFGCVTGSAVDLIHSYDFNNGFADSVGGASGTLMGNAQIQGGWLTLPGSVSPRQNYGSIPASVMNGLTSATFEGWFTLQAVNSNGKFFMAGAPDLKNYIEFDTNRGPAPGSTYSSASQSELDVFSNAPLATGVEYYFATVYDSSADEMRLYVSSGNSVSLVGAKSVPNLDLSTLSYSQFFLGASVGWGDRDLNGAIDEFHIWNGALDSSTITQHFQAGPNPLPEPSGSMLLTVGVVAGMSLRRNRAVER